MLRYATCLLAVLFLMACTGCHYNIEKKPDGPNWWLILAIGGGIVTALGVTAALNAPKDDPDQRQIGMSLALVGTVVAILGLA